MSIKNKVLYLSNKIKSMTIVNILKDYPIAQKALKVPKFSQLLYRIVQFLKPKNIIDLGTSLGITTAYFSKANPKSAIYSFEGCPNTAKIAEQNFNQLKLKNIKFKT